MNFFEVGSLDQFGFTKKINSFPLFQKKREDKRTSSKTENKYWELNFKSKYIYCVLFAIYFDANFINIAKCLFIFEKLAFQAT